MTWIPPLEVKPTPSADTTIKRAVARRRGGRLGEIGNQAGLPDGANGMNWQRFGLR